MNQFQRILIICLIAGITGCTRTSITRKADGSWTMERSSFLQRLEIPGATIATNGTWTLRGYSTDGGADVTSKIVSAAVEGAVKGAK